MKKQTVRIIALLLAVLTLSACGSKKQAETKLNAVDTTGTNIIPTDKTDPSETNPVEITPPKEIPQQPMPEEDLKRALTDVDFSVLCAELDADITKQMLMAYGYDVSNAVVVYADYDGDGYPEILQQNDIYKLSGNREKIMNGYPVGDENRQYYTDNAGNLYRVTIWGDSGNYSEDGPGVTRYGASKVFSVWKSGKWEEAFYFACQVSSDDPSVSINFETLADPSNFLSCDVKCEWYGQSCTIQEFAKKYEENGIKEVDTLPSFYTVNRYDASYRDSLLKGLDEYFAEQYDAYTKMLSMDIDADGALETVYLIPDFNNVWNKVARLDLDPGYDYDGDPNRLEDSLTGIVVADTQDNQLVIRAYCTKGNISAYEGINIHMEGNFILVDDVRIFATGSMVNTTNMYDALENYLAFYGYENCVFRTVDLCDRDAEEYLCLAYKDGRLYVLIIIIVDGNPVVSYGWNLDNTAIYLVEQDGKQHLMIYRQSVYDGYGGNSTTNYSYQLIRISQTLNATYVKIDYASYSDQDVDATQVAEFFEKLNVYLLKIIVVYDPYMLTGKQWMDQDDVQYGTVPETPQETPQDAAMGFVKIEDPSSWLNLREGPGVEYAKVLTDPSNPESFVRQALGSPVTILETIETGDEENPVWVKVRISYGDREYVGYCSKTYIRLAGE